MDRLVGYLSVPLATECSLRTGLQFAPSLVKISEYATQKSLRTDPKHIISCGAQLFMASTLPCHRRSDSHRAM